MQGHLQNGLPGEVEVHSFPVWPASRISGGGTVKFTKSWASPTLHWRGLKEREYLKGLPQNSKMLTRYRIRLNHHTESKAAISATTAATAEKITVISVSRV
jgi:hypothetical protein